MYRVGDLIYYGSAGVCRITDISEQSYEEDEKGRLYYTLKPLYLEYVIHTPVNNTKVFMRSVITKDEAERLIDMIPSISAKPYHSKIISRLAEHYEALLKTHDCADLIELTMSIQAKKQKVEEEKRKFGAVDERFMKRAEELLFSELSVALGILREEVPEYIASRVCELAQSACE